MRRLLCSIITLFILHCAAQSQTVDPDALDGHVHMKLLNTSTLELDPYTGGVTGLDLLFFTYGIDTIYKPFKLPGHPLDKVYRLRFTEIALVNGLITALEALTFVEFAEKVPLVRTTFEPDDLAPQQWYLTHVNATQAWDLERGSADVVIAVIDNAVALGHEDLSANIYVNQAEANGLPLIDDDMNGYVDDVNGYDVADRNANPSPPAGQDNSSDWRHGTHVAGIAAAVTDNGVGMAGLAHGCRILPVKVARNSSDGRQLSASSDGVFYASRSGADIINMSFGNYTGSQVMAMVIAEAAEAGAVLVAAAGNDNSEDPFYPASFPEVINVGAIDANDLRTSFSNYGSTIDVMAPGINIYSALLEGGNTYGNLSGTSMASPLVAGLAALVRSRFPTLSASEVKQRIVDSCMPIDQLNPGFEDKLGAGRINAHAALAVTGIAGTDDSHAFALHPNPAEAGQMVRTIGMGGMPFSVSVIDMTGRQVFRSDMATDGFRLPESLNSGMYAIRIRSGNNEMALRLLVR